MSPNHKIHILQLLVSSAWIDLIQMVMAQLLVLCNPRIDLDHALLQKVNSYAHKQLNCFYSHKIILTLAISTHVLISIFSFYLVCKLLLSDDAPFEILFDVVNS